MAEKRTRDARMEIRMTSGELKDAKKIASRWGVSLSDVIRLMLRNEAVNPRPLGWIPGRVEGKR
jgi:antitoxin component of RelBE/YafQ-DinJ toxin-antitoxin module